MIRLIPSRPITLGTPAQTSVTPYSPESGAYTVKMLDSSLNIASTIRQSAIPIP